MFEGKEYTRGQVANIKSNKTKNKPRYNLYHIDKGIIEESMLMSEIKKISQALYKSTKENYLGKTARSKENMCRHKKKHLIGLYIEALPFT